MVERTILRLVKKDIVKEGIEKIEAGRGTLLDEGTFSIKSYELRVEYLLLQEMGYSEVYEYSGEVTFSYRPWNKYCKWHNGPIEEADDPRKRLYCPVAADGFCRKHKSSERALYDFCLSYRGEKALEACREVDKRVKGEYIVYLLDHGEKKPKVGTTRKFRLVERIAEQPHIVAAGVYVTDSIYRARLMEINIAKTGLASELWRHKWISADLYASIIRFRRSLEAIKKELGLSNDIQMFRVKKPISTTPLKEERVEGEEFSIMNSWGGYVMLKKDGRIIIYPEKQILNTDALLVKKLKL